MRVWAAINNILTWGTFLILPVAVYLLIAMEKKNRKKIKHKLKERGIDDDDKQQEGN